MTKDKLLSVLLLLLLVTLLRPRTATDAPAPQRDVSSVTDAGGRGKLLEYGFTYLGYPYVLGADRNSRENFDCSSFVRAIYLDTYGLDIGSTTYDQHPSLPSIDAGDLMTGDLAYWDTSVDEHVGVIYWDGKQWQVLHAANPAEGVIITPLDVLNATYPLIGYRRP